VIEIVRAAGGNVALFGHGHQLRVLAARWCGLAPTDGRLLSLDPATVSVLGYEHETSVIRRWNELCAEGVWPPGASRD
jgi:probable phosphoglycerate mutase